MESGKRTLNDHNVAAFLGGLDDVTERELALVAAARAGRDAPDPLDDLRAELAGVQRELLALRGEIRGGFALVLESMHRSPQ